MNKPSFLKRNNILAVVAAFAALYARAQTPYYVTVEGGTNCTVLTNQIVSLVGYDYQSQPLVIGYFPDGGQVTISPKVNAQSPVLFSSPAIQVFTGLTNISVGGSGAATFEIKSQPCDNPNTLQVIPQGRAALVQLQTTANLATGQWTTLYSQTFTNTTPTNQFFKFTLSAP